jgi:hypothetical protein
MEFNLNEGIDEEVTSLLIPMPWLMVACAVLCTLSLVDNATYGNEWQSSRIRGRPW